MSTSDDFYVSSKDISKILATSCETTPEKGEAVDTYVDKGFDINCCLRDGELF